MPFKNVVTDLNPTGRPRKADSLKKTEGTYRADRATPDSAPKLPLQLCEPPQFMGLTAGEKKVFAQLAADLYRLKVTTAIDSIALALLARAIWEYKKFSAIVRHEGAYFETATAEGNRIQRAHAAKGLRDQSALEIQRGLAQFGLTPNARSRLQVLQDDTPVEEEKDPWKKMSS